MGDGTVPDDWAHAPAQPAGEREPAPLDDAARFTRNRDGARWTAAIGFLMLFAGRFSVALAAGGLVMAAYGAAASFYWSRRLRKLKGDPWAYDPELDGPEQAEWQRR